MIKNKKGMGLVLVIIIMSVLSILGFAILQISLAQTKHAAHDKSRMQAYYLAKSGVEATVAWMTNPANNGYEIINKESDETELTGSDINGTFIVKVIEEDGAEESPGYILVKGTGTVNHVSASTSMIVKKGTSDAEDAVFDDTVYGEVLVTLSGKTTIEGTVCSPNPVITNGKSMEITGNGGVPIQKDKEMPDIPFTIDPTMYENYNSVTDGLTLDIAGTSNKTMAFNEMKLSGNDTLTIITGSTGNIVKLYVADLALNNDKVVLDGSGILYIYVTNSASLKAKETNYNFDPRRLFIFLDAGSSATIDGNRKLNGFIYGPKANVTLSGDGGVKGALVAGTATISGNPIVSNEFGNFGDIGYNDLPFIFFTRGPWITD